MVSSPPVFTADTPPTTATVGLPYSSYSFAASGYPTPIYSVASGALPAGLTLDPVAGTLSGTPTTAGTSTFTVQADNGVSPTAVSPPITIVTFSAPAFTADTPADRGDRRGSVLLLFVRRLGKSDAGLLGRERSAAGRTHSRSGRGHAVGDADHRRATSTFTVQAANGVGSPAVSGSITINVSQYLPLQLSVPGGALGTPDSGDGASSGTLDPVTSGPPGTRLILSASGFKPGETVQPIWAFGSGSPIPQASFYEYDPQSKVSSSGAALADMWVPDTAGGTYSVALEGLTSGYIATASFTVTPSLDTGSAIAPPGSVLRLGGWGFGPKEKITVTFQGQTIATASTDSKGTFGGRTYTVPTSTQPGVYTMRASGATSGFSTNTSFTVGNIPVGAAPGPDDWASWGFNQQQDRVNPTETTIGASNVSELSPKWTAQLSQPDLVEASPYEANGIVYVGTVHGMIYAFNQQSGSLLWSFQALGPVYGTPTIVNGIAYFGTVDVPNEGIVGNWAYALNAQTGAVVWADPLPNGGEWTSPTVVGSVVVFQMAYREGISGGETALNASTGAVAWEFNTPYGIWAPATVDPNGSVIYQDTGNPCTSNGAPPPTGDACSGYVLALNVNNGSTIWSDHMPDFSGDDDIPTAAAYDAGNLYIGSKNGIEYEVSASNGAIEWQYNTGSDGDFGIYSSAAVTGGTVFFGGGDRRLHAVNESTGALEWTASIGGGLVVSSPAVANGVLYVEGTGGAFDAINPSNGQVLWSQQLSSGAFSSPTIDNGAVYAVDDAGTLEALTINGN